MNLIVQIIVNKLLYIIMILCASLSVSSAAALPYVDSVMFYRVDSAEQALHLVDNGLLDMYYFSVPPHLLEGYDNIEVHTNSAGGLLSILLNPAKTDEFNPFSITEVRFAVNYMIDREGIVSDLLDGYGSSAISLYAPFEPDYTRVLEQTASFGIHYDLDLAKDMIHNGMTNAGAVLRDDTWRVDGEPVTVKIFIRDDDPIRFSIGNTLASNLEDMGFVVEKMHGNLAMAFATVYGSNPADLGWHAYTEGWGGGFDKYNDDGLAVFYAPWRTNMPGSNNPEFWSYQNEELDEITRLLYNGKYTSEDERTRLLQEAMTLGVQEAVRVFLAAPSDTFVVNNNVDGVINSVTGGLSNTLTLNNAQNNDDIILRVGVKHLGQSSWNPVAGHSDVYSRDIEGPLSDPASIAHPYTADVIPLRAERTVETAGPGGTLQVPSNAVTWNPYIQQWSNVGPGVTATSVVTIDYTFSNWHHGPSIDMQDILYGIYFMYEWGTVTSSIDATQDSEYTTTTGPFLEDTFVAVRQMDDDTLKVYLNYWHFDEDEIGLLGARWADTPWELFFAMEQIVKDGKAAFSTTESTSKDIPWLSTLSGTDAGLIREYLLKYAYMGVTPKALGGLDNSYYTDRYMAAVSWIDEHGHAKIDHGAFYLASYDDEKGVAFIREFTDTSYPYAMGKWSHFVEPTYPDISSVDASIVTPGRPLNIDVSSVGTDTLRYFLTHNGTIIHNGEISSRGMDRITISSDITDNISTCPLSLLLFAVSDDVIIPDAYSTDVTVSSCGHPEINMILSDLTTSEKTTFLRILLTLLDDDISNISSSDIDALSDNTKINTALLAILELVLDGELTADDIMVHILNN